MLIKVECLTAWKCDFVAWVHILCLSQCWESVSWISSLLEQSQLLSSLVLQMKEPKQRTMNLPQVTHLVSGGTVIWILVLGFPDGSARKESACNAGGLGSIPWRKERLPTPVFWPGEFHGLYSPQVAKSQYDWATFTFFLTLTFWLVFSFLEKPCFSHTMIWVY